MGIDPIITPSPSPSSGSPSASPNFASPNVSSDPIDSTAAADFIASGAETFNVGITTPGTISAQSFYSTTTSAQIAQNEQSGLEAQNYALYYNGFSSSLVSFLQHAEFLDDNINNVVAASNAANTDETNLFGPGTNITNYVSSISQDINSVIPQAVATLNQAAIAYQQNGDINAWNAAVAKYNTTIAGTNNDLNNYNGVVPNYNSQISTINPNIELVNQYVTNFSPPLPAYPTMTALPTLATLNAPPAPSTPGQEIAYTPPSFTASVPSSIVQPLTSTQVSQGLTSVDSAAQQANYILSQQKGNISTFFNIQQFGFRVGVPLNPAPTQVNTATSTGSTSAFATGSPDPKNSSKTLGSSISSDIVKAATHSLGVATGGTLTSNTGYLVSGLFQNTGIYSTRQALQLAGFNVGPINLGQIVNSPAVEDVTNAPVHTNASDLDAEVPAAGTAPSGQVAADATAGASPIGATATAQFSTSVAGAGSTPILVPQPPANNGETISSVTPTSSQVTAGISTAAALATVNTTNTLNGTNIINTTVTNLVNKDPSLATLSPSDKANLINAIGSSVSLDLSLTSLYSLSVALGAPSLLQQYAANVLPLQDAFPITNNDSPLQTVITNPAYQAFIEASISSSLSNALGLSQAQADNTASSVLSAAISSGNIQNAQQLSDELNTEIQNGLVSQGINAVDAQNAANRALSDLENQQLFNSIQEAVIQKDQTEDAIANSFIQAGIAQSQAEEVAKKATDQNRDLFTQLANTSDQQEAAKLKGEIQANIEAELAQNVNGNAALAASQQAYNALNTIGPANLAIQKANANTVIPPEQLQGEISTLVSYNLAPLIGSQNASSQGAYFADQIVASNSSLRSQNSDHVNAIIHSTNNQNSDTLAANMNVYLRPTTEGYVAAQNFMDPGKTVTHNALTGVMYSEPVAIKNTPSVVPV